MTRNNHSRNTLHPHGDLNAASCNEYGWPAGGICTIIYKLGGTFLGALNSLRTCDERVPSSLFTNSVLVTRVTRALFL